VHRHGIRVWLSSHSAPQDKEIEIRLSQSGVPALNGFYRPALISISYGLHEVRKVAPRGNGKEIVRFKHVTSNAAVICTTNGPVVSVVMSENESIRTPARPIAPPEGLDLSGSADNLLSGATTGATHGAVNPADEPSVVQDPVEAPTQPLRWTVVDDQQVCGCPCLCMDVCALSWMAAESQPFSVTLCSFFVVPRMFCMLRRQA
jgi:hypothetical protein